MCRSLARGACHRAIGRAAGVISLALMAGCTLILDFEDPPAPVDALQLDAIDPGACELGEPNQTRPAAFPLDLATDLDAAICEPGDHDFYSISVDANQTVTVAMSFVQQGSRGDLDLRLYDGNGNVVARSASADSDERIVCPSATPPVCVQLEAGPYFIEVYGFEDQHVNAYSIRVDAAPN
jgi:hypothetical protein